MAKWINKKGWLYGYVQPKVNENNVSNKSNVMVHVPLKCPSCRSRSVRCYGADKPILYYKCVDCDLKFKVLEKDDV